MGKEVLLLPSLSSLSNVSSSGSHRSTTAIDESQLDLSLSMYLDTLREWFAKNELNADLESQPEGRSMLKEM